MGAPYHLWAKAKLAGGWDTRRKPSVALEAMDAYPGKTLILMDVDCIVRGDIGPVANVTGDVGLILKARQTRKGRAWQKRVAVVLSSRVVVFRPTEGARAFAQEWAGLCEKAHYAGDETAMTWAYLRRPEVAFSYLDDRYRAWEVDGYSTPQDAVIMHASAHDKAHSWDWSWMKRGLKAVERRYFRSGRTKRETEARLG